MQRVETLNLIHLFDFYLAAMFVIGLYRRRGVYLDTVKLFLSTLGQRRRLLGVLNANKRALLSGAVLRPLFLAVGLTVTQWILSRVVFHSATLTFAELWPSWWKNLLVIGAFVPMAVVDIYFLIRVGRFDHGETSKYLDTAEKWLGKRGSAVKAVTLGIVNPRKIVDREVEKNLKELGETVSWSMWWVSVQIILRMTFGLIIWVLWATRE